MLDELVSLTCPLARFGEVVDEMHAGRVARGVLTFD
jgi:Zn-dependent alcohol dehydrogenase